MISYNCVILTGKIATPPRRHYRPDGFPVVQFPLELNGSEDPMSRQTTRLNGITQAMHRPREGLDDRSLIDIVAFGDLAEFKFDLLKSGQHLLVMGRLNQRHWQTPEGKKRTHTEVIATDLLRVEETNYLFVDGKDESKREGKKG
jgi:single-strand DNA-binding protein